ncbi:Fis family transcriptional regulator [Melaminivora sp.]|uniref:Fis family transcriptional regulator n=1 Tax=Melaminivora sp. TaxID=1933032 RepID=UPI0028AC887C|nr:Fis family transcriptional regulator [Melaminivora sp.]
MSTDRPSNDVDSPAANGASLEQCVRESLQGYFRDLGGEAPDGVYDMVVRLVERPLLEVVMSHAQQNQSRAAQWLGLNRNTLRKKLAQHQLL